MNVEASIAERLQKLREWQMQQQEKLLKQQRLQREILSHNQDCIYKALGLPMHDFDIDEGTKDARVENEIGINAKEMKSDKTSTFSTKDSNGALEIILLNKRISMNSERQRDDSDYASKIVDKSEDDVNNHNSNVAFHEFNDSLIEGIKPLSSDNVSNVYTSMDDVPLPSPKKDFQTLLEEKLKRESEGALNVRRIDAKPKRPFLKKGQGLLRFKMSTNLRSSVITMKKHNAHIDKNNESKKTVVHKLSKIQNVPAKNEKRQLSLKDVSLSEKIVDKSHNRTTHNVTSDRSRQTSGGNISDCELKAEKELEEVRIFELLEEKAENSSFCSTSSTVLAFLQESTPFKIKSELNRMKRENLRDTVADKDRQNNKRNDTAEQDEFESTIQQIALAENLKSSTKRQVEPHKYFHNDIITTDSYWDTAGVDNTKQETCDYFTSTNLPLQRKTELMCTKHPADRDISVVTVSSNSDSEGRDNFTDNDDSIHDRKTDDNHHVRFSKYNEYKTIDLIDVSDTASNPSSKDYPEQQDWNGHTIDTSKSFDVEEELPFNYKRQSHNLLLQMISDEKGVDVLKRLSLRQEITDATKRNKKDSYNRLMRSVSFFEEGNDSSSYKNESPDEDTCYDNECTPMIGKIAQTSDEERFVLSSPVSSSSVSSDCTELHAQEEREYALRNESEQMTKGIAKVCSNLKKLDFYSSEGRTNPANTFETELLKNRLLELEKEIDIFRKESTALLFQRRKLQEEETILHKRYTEKEKIFEENKRRIQSQLEEEKKRIAREKIAMENRIRDAQEKAKQNKIERQKMQNLREELEELRDELNVKESRWNAAESRYKSELRVLRVEITKLKQEIVNVQNIKKTNVRNLRGNTGRIITKAINQINKRVTVAPKESLPMKTCQNFSNALSDNEDNENEQKNRNKLKAIDVIDSFEQKENVVPVNKVKRKQAEITVKSQSEVNKDLKLFPEENVVEKRRQLYESLLKDAASDLLKNPDPFHSFYAMQDTLNDPQPIITQIEDLNVKSNDSSYSSPANKDLDCTDHIVNDVERYIDRSREASQEANEIDTRIEEETRKDRISSPEKNLNSALHPPCRISKTNMDAVKQIQFSDGRLEYWYPNGNVKKIFPDQKITKMIYYNGDVRETDKNKKIRYFYAATRTWHTTTPDGLEILQFPDGQVEKRMSDGTVQVLFPDGTVAETFANGDKILTLPNGQREVHTKAHKRREYPDGTIKLVYADGTQETRYSNGRKRMKDRDGNLLMDSYNT